MGRGKRKELLVDSSRRQACGGGEGGGHRGPRTRGVGCGRGGHRSPRQALRATFRALLRARHVEVEAVGGRVHLGRRAESGSGCGLRGEGGDLSEVIN